MRENQKDNLTGFMNRKAFEDEFKVIMEKAKEGQKIVSLVSLDIDRFKRINDEHGHEIGDEVIKSFSEAIKDIVGDKAIVSRYGGEEFVILFPEMEREQAFLSAERIRGEMDKIREFQAEGKTVKIKVTISGGVAAYPPDGHSENEVMRKADHAMYRAKITGRNKICMAQEERMATKTTHFTLTQLERLTQLSKVEEIGEAALLREALDDLLIKYNVSDIET